MNLIYEMQLFLLNLPKNMFEVTADKIQALDSRLRKEGRVVIVSHEHPDGDAVGSTTALWHFLKVKYGIVARIIYPDCIPPSLAFLTECVDYMTADDEGAEEAIRDAGLVFCLDFNNFPRTGRLQQHLRGSAAFKVLVDHHPFPEEGCFDILFSRTDISSASELLYCILVDMPGIGGDAGRLPAECARSLMTGMTTDTNNFANSVYPSTLRMASDLIAAGVDRDSIIELIYNSGREEKLRAWSHLLDNSLTIMECGVAYIVLDLDTRERFGLLEGETDGLVNIPLKAAKVRVSALITEEKDHFRISLRSRRNIAVNTLAGERFNGGGHPQAAGGRISVPADLDDKKNIRQYFEDIAARFMRDADTTRDK